MVELSERERRRRFKNRVLLVALLAFVVVVYAVSVVRMGGG
jgi:cytochrome c biogenesis factor